MKVLSFTAGVGEHSAPIRARVCEGLEYLGIKIDDAKNQANDIEIQTSDSKVKVVVIPTDEELIIARETAKVIG